MARSWFVDYLTGWVAQLDEIGVGGSGVALVVTNEYGRSWAAVRDTIDEAFEVAYRVAQEKENTHERELVDALINPNLNYESNNNYV
jgi:hypothetical protein